MTDTDTSKIISFSGKLMLMDDAEAERALQDAIRAGLMDEHGNYRIKNSGRSAKTSIHGREEKPVSILDLF